MINLIDVELRSFSMWLIINEINLTRDNYNDVINRYKSDKELSENF